MKTTHLDQTITRHSGQTGTASRSAATTAVGTGGQPAETPALNAGRQPLALLHASTIERLNAVLAPELGDNALARAAGMDFSPAATADRIASAALGGFGAYQQRHPEMDGEAALDGYMDLIGGAIEQGFREARDILEGLNVLGGGIAADIDRTQREVSERLSAFRQSRRDALQG